METSGLAVNNIRWRLTSFSSHIIFHVILKLSSVHSFRCSYQFPDKSTAHYFSHLKDYYLAVTWNLTTYFPVTVTYTFFSLDSYSKCLNERFIPSICFFTGNCPSFVATEESCNRCFRTHCSYMTSGHSPEAHWSLEARWGPENQQLWSLFSVALGRTWQDP